MPIKDYYKTLGIATNAKPEELKKAYRELALKYHPDRNQDNPYAEAQFKELQEAYSILSHSARRKAYDEERWLSGMADNARRHTAVTPAWILDESRKLSRHMATIDTYRMSHRSLRDYVLLLLSDAHMAVLQQHAEMDTNSEIIAELITATRNLEYNHMSAVAHRLAELSAGDLAMLNAVEQALLGTKKRARRDKYLPWLVCAAAMLLAIIMYFYGHK